MIRPFTCLCLAAACGSGLYLYSEKHRTVLLDREISSVINQTQAARARTGLLRAEWALLNEPGRLQEMADKYLSLKPMAPSQFVQLADLPSHLPAPETAAEASAQDQDESTTDAAPVAAPTNVPVPGPASPSADANPLSADANPEIILPKHVLEPKPAAAAKLLAHADVKAKASHRVVLADRAYVPPANALARGTPIPLAAPQPTAHIFPAMARPMSQPSAHQQIVSAVPREVSPYIGSALGGRGSLPPPVPYGGAQ
jgi:hypothetical protein